MAFNSSPVVDTDPNAPHVAFEIRQARPPAASGLIFASPHSGNFYPADMDCAADRATVRSVEDAAMDQLIASGPDHGATLLIARYGRAYVDLNRAETDLDPALIGDCPSLEPSPKTLAGYGVLHRLAGDRQPLYQRRLTLAEANRRLDRVYRPYHDALAGLMTQAKDQYGQALLIDWHSMPQRATGANGPDIILGDRHGTSCDVFWTRTLRALCEAQGWRVGLNRPYAGGYATQKWGHPEEGLHALQIEVNRRLYWDEINHQPAIGWKRCHSALKRVIAELGPIHAQRLGRE